MSIKLIAKDLYKQLSHPIRREIVSLLSNNGAMSVTAILDKLDMSPGNFYYHIRFLKGLVRQDENGQYYLTEVGSSVNAKFISREDTSVLSFPNPTENRFLSYLCFTKLVGLIYENRTYRFLLIPIILLEELLYSYKGVLFMGFIIKLGESQGLIEVLASSAISWMYVLSISIGFLLLTERPVRLAGLVGSYAFAQLPLLLGLTVPTLILRSGFGSILFLGLLAWSLTIFAAGFSRSGNLSMNSAALVTISAAYVNVAILLLQISFFV